MANVEGLASANRVADDSDRAGKRRLELAPRGSGRPGEGGGDGGVDDERGRPRRLMRRLARGGTQGRERGGQRRPDRHAARRTLEQYLGERSVAPAARQLDMAKAGPAQDLRLGGIAGSACCSAAPTRSRSP